MKIWSTAFSLDHLSIKNQVMKENYYLINELLLKKWVAENLRNLTLIC